MPPAPLPISTPAPGSDKRRPASCQASLAAITAISDALEYRRGSGRPLRSPRPFGARSAISTASSIETGGTGAATAHGNCEASNSVIARVALQPRLTWRQKLSRPTPYGETTPMPVIATRGVNGSIGLPYNIASFMPIAGAARHAGHLRIAWAGAAVFLASLLWAAYSYLFGFDARAAANGVAVAV